MKPERKKKLEEWLKEADLSEEDKQSIINYYERKDSYELQVEQVVIPEIWSNEDCYRIHRRRIIPIKCPKCGNIDSFLCDDVVNRRVPISGIGIVTSRTDSGYAHLKMNRELTCLSCGHKFKTYNGPAVWDMDEKIITSMKKAANYIKARNKKIRGVKK